MRFLTTVLDKHSLLYNQRRRKGEFNRGKKPSSVKRGEEGNKE
jgi:small subunit ribosomal protein S6